MKIILMVLIAILAFGGTFIGLAYAGIVDVPGITPKKTKKSGEDKSAPSTAEDAPQTPVEKQPSTAQPTGAEAPTDAVSTRKDGSERVAKIWSSMDAESVVAILSQWDDGDALTVLALMEDKKLAELLSLLPPDRAARLSIGIKSLEGGGKR